MLIRSTLCVEFGPENSMGLRPPLSSLVTIAAAAADVAVPSEQKVYDVILKQSSLVKKKSALTTALDVKPDFAIPGSLSLLKEASDRCGEDCAEYAKTFYLDMGIAPESNATAESVYYRAALALGIANQLANILGDVGEDARGGRIYLPQDELARFGLSDDDIFTGKVWASLPSHLQILDEIDSRSALLRATQRS
ncbi:hypothetical protein OPV22_000356 [Ensete ventricosum]|uniref:15-cis-phytoene synthase n=1 Tax=Ensete ventricosum TaxID=4639 RepID=A0AAV8RMU8_ENSVE|nr:hypothetical protein OPV22_000356 [Ensete ventricosum]